LAVSVSVSPVAPEDVTPSHGWSDVAVHGTFALSRELSTRIERVNRPREGKLDNATPSYSGYSRWLSTLSLTGVDALTTTPFTLTSKRAVPLNTPGVTFVRSKLRATEPLCTSLRVPAATELCIHPTD
jgi:hypothetical protein